MSRTSLRRLERELRGPQGPRFERQRDRIVAALGALSSGSRTELAARIRGSVEPGSPPAVFWEVLAAAVGEPTRGRLAQLEEAVMRLSPVDRQALVLALSQAIYEDTPRSHVWLRVKALVEAVQRDG